MLVWFESDRRMSCTTKSLFLVGNRPSISSLDQPRPISSLREMVFRGEPSLVTGNGRGLRLRGPACLRSRFTRYLPDLPSLCSNSPHFTNRFNAIKMALGLFPGNSLQSVLRGTQPFLLETAVRMAPWLAALCLRLVTLSGSRQVLPARLFDLGLKATVPAG